MWRCGFLLIAAVLAAQPVGAASVPKLSARPAEVSQQLPAGISRIGDSAFVFRPQKATGPLPLVVLLHGAGGDARRFLEGVTASAERLGYVVLAPQSASTTWDVVRQSRFGPDVERIDAALAQLFARQPIDRKRIAISGFSDGASYALSLGVANPQLFRGIVAMSPGFVTGGGRLDSSQRLFIAHGRNDRVLPFSNVTRNIVPPLEAAGLRARVHWFDGGHVIDPAIFEEGVRYALGKGLG